MQIRKVLWLLAPFFLLACTLKSQPHKTWLYINSFQQGKFFVFDLATAKVVHTIPVEDASGSMGLGVTSDGKKLFIVDGDTSYRLRVVDAATGSQLAEYTFNDRVLLLGGGPVLHLTADNRWLFVKTYDYGAAATGVRIFDVEAGSFTTLGLRGRECEAPKLVSARDGTLVAVCPQLIHELKPLSAVQGEFLPGPWVSMSITERADVALSPDGNNLYVLGYVQEDSPWLLAHWTKGNQKVYEHDLSMLLEMVPDAPGRGGQAWLDVSPDGKTLGLVHGPRLWLLDQQTLEILHRIDLPWPADEAAFTLDGRSILTLRGTAGGDTVKEALLLQISVMSGELQKVSLNGLKLPAGPTIFKVASAP